MQADSADVCAKIAHACDAGAASRRQLARQFRVSVAFLQQMRRRRRLTGRLAAAPHTGGRHGVLDAEALGLVARLIRAPNDLALAERCARVAAARRVPVSVPTRSRAVRRLRWPYKKRSCTPPSAIPRACRPSACTTAT